MRYLMITMAMFIMTGLFAQEKTREEKKAEREAEKQERMKRVEAMVENKQFVLEADYLRDRRGQSIPVNSTINFVSLDSNRAVFQFGSAHTVGYNGVGGATIEGKVTSWDMRELKRGGYYVRVTISSTLGFYDINFSISSTGMAEATVTANTRGRLIYSGDLVALHESRVYEGTSY